MWTMIYHMERGRTRQEFIVPFKAKPRWYLEFQTCSNPSKCGYHCTHSLRLAYFCPPLYTIQHKTFSQFLTVWTKIVHTASGWDNHCPHCYRCGQNAKNVEKKFQDLRSIFPEEQTKVSVST